MQQVFAQLDKESIYIMELKFITQTVCAGCKALEAYLDNVHPDVEYELINIDETPEAIEEYEVTSTPTLILWDDDFGEEVSRQIGFQPGKNEEDVEELLLHVE